MVADGAVWLRFASRNLNCIRAKKQSAPSDKYCMDIKTLSPKQLKRKLTKKLTLEELKFQWIIAVWLRHNGNQKETAAELGVERHTVARYVEKLRARPGDNLLRDVVPYGKR